MSKYVWDFDKEKIKTFSRGSTNQDFLTISNGYKILPLNDKNVELIPIPDSKFSYLESNCVYGDGDGGHPFNKYIWDVKNYSYDRDRINKIYVKLDGEFMVLRVSISIKNLMNFVKKLFPTISINGQNIGGLKLKDSSGVIKEVSNIVYKDNSGNIKNLK